MQHTILNILVQDFIPISYEPIYNIDDFGSFFVMSSEGGAERKEKEYVRGNRLHLPMHKNNEEKLTWSPPGIKKMLDTFFLGIYIGMEENRDIREIGEHPIDKDGHLLIARNLGREMFPWMYEGRIIYGDLLPDGVVIAIREPELAGCLGCRGGEIGAFCIKKSTMIFKSE